MSTAAMSCAPDRDGALLDQLQALVAQINDAPVSHAISGFHLAERSRCAALLGRALDAGEDEQLLLQDTADEAALSVFVDGAVLRRLEHRNPLEHLSDENLADFCTALEGVSHFQYVVWCIEHQRQLSLLELEFQGEVDKYSVAVCLLRRQGHADLPRGLLHRLFDEFHFVRSLPPDTLRRYVEANRAAARFCAMLERRFLSARHFRPEHWLRALRDSYRRSHHQKLRFALQ